MGSGDLVVRCGLLVEGDLHKRAARHPVFDVGRLGGAARVARLVEDVDEPREDPAPLRLVRDGFHRCRETRAYPVLEVEGEGGIGLEVRVS